MKNLTERIAWELDEVVARIFDAMTQLACVPACDAAVSLTTMCAEIHFNGQIRGQCRLSMKAEDAQAYAVAMLGEIDELSEELHSDSLGELCNMIAGGWKSLQPPPPGWAAMSPPRVSGTPTGEWSDAVSLVRRYVFGAHHFQVELALDVADAAELLRAGNMRAASVSAGGVGVSGVCASSVCVGS